ncbi:MAG: DUF805 domain-containing protein [Bacteroidales bacterium]
MENSSEMIDEWGLKSRLDKKLYRLYLFETCFGLAIAFLSKIVFLEYTMLIVAIVILILSSNMRCHDIGKSGWYQLIPFYFIYLIFAPSKIEDNKYISYPKMGLPSRGKRKNKK